MRKGYANVNRVRGTITIQTLLDDRTSHATLPNGKIILAHLPRHQNYDVKVGDVYGVMLSLNDFSHGEIILPDT